MSAQRGQVAPADRPQPHPAAVGPLAEVLGEPREVGAGAAQQAPPAASALHGIHGQPGDAQRFEVAAGGALGHLQLQGDLRCSDLLALLQQQENGY